MFRMAAGIIAIESRNDSGGTACLPQWHCWVKLIETPLFWLDSLHLPEMEIHCNATCKHGEIS